MAEFVAESYAFLEIENTKRGMINTDIITSKETP